MNLGFPEMLFLFLLALLLFGPKKLPEIGRQIGRGLAEFKRASNELKGQLENEMRLLEAEDREKMISPPPRPPENTVAASGETASVSTEPAAVAAVATAAPTDAAPHISTPLTADHQQGVAAAASDPPPSPGPGVEGA
ncbi:MAG TPA: twin-arginine translocase TatA/TatE family subunit [Terriglobales bacterium]|nr:twin-arginine translocase TatA/TatE family subunit [Terriglobales bacterium]